MQPLRITWRWMLKQAYTRRRYESQIAEKEDIDLVTTTEVQFREASKKLAALLADTNVVVNILNHLYKYGGIPEIPDEVMIEAFK
ncbi:hypothetical protein L6164_018975 [Bauhinia variegata]|uniref:Uncharacterized protein n=1 Tax=Bauhinia variegata TaxID=167791 RepID=A0ACB9NHT9_BAUVA|nr:hypothetical protein L6164_018975 [Bauhinia variegata]